MRECPNTIAIMLHKKKSQQIVQESINLLIYGSKVEKYNSELRKPKAKGLYILEDDMRYLEWVSKRKEYSESRFLLTNICDIRYEAPVEFEEVQASNLKEEHFLLIEGMRKERLLLVFGSAAQRDLWHDGLLHFIDEAWTLAEEEEKQSELKQIAVDLFTNADKDGSKGLDFEETVALLRTLHLNLDEKKVKALFQKYDKNKNNIIELDEFKCIIGDLLEKNELRQVYERYAELAEGESFSEDALLMTEAQLCNFLVVEQGESETTAEEITQKFMENNIYEDSENEEPEGEEKNLNIETEEESNEKKAINFYEFAGLLFTGSNTLFDPKKLDVYENMGRPLTDYYINSSHNTYLTQNQLTGDADVNAYKDVLLRGCRCVEIDTWDGSKEPIVTHGYTLTSSLNLRDVVKQINEYAFINSAYPVILSIENHCSKRETKLIGTILQEILGSKLYRLPKNFGDFKFFKSPRDLEHRIIVKSKVNLASLTEINPESLDAHDYYANHHDSDEIFAEREQEHHRRTLTIEEAPLSPRVEERSPSLDDNSLNRWAPEGLHFHNTLGNEAETDENPLLLSVMVSANELDIEESLEESNDDKAIEDTINGEPQVGDLRDVLTLFGHGVRSDEPRTQHTQQSCWHIVSEEESYIQDVWKSSERSIRVADYCRHFLLRVYPSGTRIDSSNYDPIAAFALGCQLVALNFETADLPLLLNYARFQENGAEASGYVLKPKWLRSDATEEQLQLSALYYAQPPSSPLKNTDEQAKNLLEQEQLVRQAKRFTLTVISAEELRYDDEELDARAETLSPSVEVTLRGARIDEEGDSSAVKKTTITVPDNGLNPIFDNSQQNNFEFNVRCPDIAMLLFQVFSQGDLVAWYALPVNCIRPGYRTVPLWSRKLNPINHSYLFVKIKFLQN